jgi:hypothetical protein
MYLPTAPSIFVSGATVRRGWRDRCDYIRIRQEHYSMDT